MQIKQGLAFFRVLHLVIDSCILSKDLANNPLKYEKSSHCSHVYFWVWLKIQKVIFVSTDDNDDIMQLGVIELMNV